MKKIYLSIIALTAVFCGCVSEDMENPAEEPSVNLVTISLSTESAPEILDGLAETRTVLKGTAIEWHNGDALLAMDGNNPYKLTNVNPDGPEALFVGEVPDTWLMGDWNYVMYPYDAYLLNHEWGRIRQKGNKYGMEYIILPSVQPLVPGTFARSYNYSAAGFKFSEDKALEFKNLGGLIGLTLTGNATVRSVSITAPADINGTFHWEFASRSSTARFDVLELYYQHGGFANPIPSPVVTLVSDEGVVLGTEPQTFYACTMACETVGDYTIVIETEQQKTFTYTVAMDKGFKISQLLSLGEFDLTYTIFDLDGQTVEFDPTGREIKELLLVTEEAPVIIGLPAWLACSVDGNKLTFTPEMNLSRAGRSAEVTIIQGEESATVVVNQEFIPVVNATSFGCDSSPAASDVFVLEEFFTGGVVGWDIRCDAWITLDRGSNSFIISVPENTSGRDRTGSVEIIDGAGNVVTEISVLQTAFNYESLKGYYSFNFTATANGWRQDAWKLTFTGNPDDESSYLVNAVRMGGADMSPYCPDIRFDYVSQGADGPYLKLVGPQYFAGSGLYLRATAKNGAEITEDGIGYDLMYAGQYGEIRFDFVPNDAAVLGYPDGLHGLGIYNISDKSVWETMNPPSGKERLSIVMWGRNHEGFLPN